MGLRVESLTVTFGATTAVDDVDLEVAAGEVLCILGPSGCGKSTLLRAITGLVRPDRGRVLWDGTDLTSTPVHRRGFGLMFQDHALFPHRDVQANVAFGLRMQDLPRRHIRARVDELLDMVGMSGYGGRSISELSGGEQQRVALARALAPAPRVLLLDEPMGSLDRVLRDRLVGDLAVLFDRLDTAVVYVTHDHDEALVLGDRVAIMRDGRLVQAGSPEQVWGAPADDFVAEFLAGASVVDGATLGLEVGPVVVRRLRRHEK